jgi:thioredoxin reductase (NADPH)
MESISLGAAGAPYDLIVIGGGPAGSTAALYAARAGHRTLVIDKGLASGALGKASQIVNYPGAKGPLTGADLVRSMRDQAASFGAEFVTEKVLRVDLKAEPKQVWAAEPYQARAVVIATGALGRQQHVPGEERLLGRGVSYCATCDGAFFQGQPVAVAGNNDEAVDEALTMTRFATKVHLLSPTTELEANEELAQELASHPKAALHLGVRVLEVLGENRVEGVRFAAKKGDQEEQTIPVSGVFFYLQGTQPITDFLYDQLPVSEGGCLIAGEYRETTLPGVFAAGDVVCKHLKQSVVAAAEGAQAAMAADRYLSGREKLRPDWRHS